MAIMLLPESVIIEVQSYPGLYKLDHPEYLNNSKKEEYFFRISEKITNLYNVPVTKEDVKLVWEKLVQMHKNHKRENASMPVEAKKVLVDVPLLSQLSFLDERIAHRAVISSLHTDSSSSFEKSSNQTKKSTIWKTTVEENREKISEECSEYILPKTDLFYRKRKQQSAENFNGEMHSIVGALRNCAEVMAISEKKIRLNTDCPYEPLILELFNSSKHEDDRDKLMLILLKVIQSFQ